MDIQYIFPELNEAFWRSQGHFRRCVGISQSVWSGHRKSGWNAAVSAIGNQIWLDMMMSDHFIRDVSLE